MDSALSGQIWWTIPLLLIAAEIVAFWPFRRVRQFVLSRVITPGAFVTLINSRFPSGRTMSKRSS
jgi:hypothetical protein